MLYYEKILLIKLVISWGDYPAFSEMERELIKERVKAGLYAAHAKGRKGGRPKALTPEKEKKLKLLLKGDQFSVTEICKIVGITRSVYYRAVKNSDA